MVIIMMRRVVDSYVCIFAIICALCMVQHAQCDGLQHGFNSTLLLKVFQEEFPLQDGTRLASSESELIKNVLFTLSSLGVPLNASLVTVLSEEKLLQVYMLAVTGNLVKEKSKSGMFRVDAVNAKIVLADTYENNRQLIFEIMVFALLFVLGKTWFVHVK
jgi:hypothetical protein